MSAVAVLHHFRYGDGDTLISAAVDGKTLFNRWSKHDTDASMRSDIVDAFLDMWNDHGSNGLIIYVSDRTISRLLKEQSAQFSGLQVRDVISGERLRETWDVCRNSHSEQQVAIRPLPIEIEKQLPPVLVIATDASKGKNKKAVGISAVTAEGNIRTRCLELKSIFDGELAAIHLALSNFGQRAQRIEILTDSRKAVQYVNGWTSLKAETGEILMKCIKDLAALGIEVSITWVRGHNGHVLNNFADRAAVIARRCEQFATDNKAQLIENLRAELRSEITGIEPQQWLPQPQAA